MGINGLFPLLCQHVPMTRVTQAGGLTAAIDFGTLVHKFAKAKAVCEAAATEPFEFGSAAHVVHIVNAMERVSGMFSRTVWVLDNPGKNPAKVFEHRRRSVTTARGLELAVVRDMAFGRIKASVGDKRTFATMVESEPELEAIMGKTIGPALATGEITLEVAIEARERELERSAFQRGTVGSSLIREIRSLAGSRGMDSIVAPLGVEAEHLAATLQARGLFDAVVSEDMDTVCFGATRMLCKYDGVGFTSIELADILSGLGISMAQLIDLGILAGSDFTDRTPKGVAAVTAYKLIKQHQTIEAVLEFRNEPADLEGFGFEAARHEFKKTLDYPDEFVV